jgi:hypothetical protein
VTKHRAQYRWRDATTVRVVCECLSVVFVRARRSEPLADVEQRIIEALLQQGHLTTVLDMSTGQSEGGHA